MLLRSLSNGQQALENVVRADTEATIGDMDLLHRINVHATERYQAIADAAVGLDTDSAYLREKCSTSPRLHPPLLGNAAKSGRPLSRR